MNVGGLIILRSVGQEEDETQRFHGDKRETLGRGATSDFREHDHRQTQTHLSGASTDPDKWLVFKMTLVGRERAGDGSRGGGVGGGGLQREAWLSTGCSFWNGRRVTLHRRRRRLFFLAAQSRAALFSWLCCYLDGKVAICQKLHSSSRQSPLHFISEHNSAQKQVAALCQVDVSL